MPVQMCTYVGIGSGKAQGLAFLDALRGRLINGVITNESTAALILAA